MQNVLGQEMMWLDLGVSEIGSIRLNNNRCSIPKFTYQSNSHSPLSPDQREAYRPTTDYDVRPSPNLSR